MKMNTVEMLERVKNTVLKNLRADEVLGIEAEDLEQEIMMAALELIRSGVANGPYTVGGYMDLAEQTLAKVRKSLRNEHEAEDHQVGLEDAIREAVLVRYYSQERKAEQTAARDAVDELLTEILTPTEECVVRLRYGIPSVDLCECFSTLEIRPYMPADIAMITGLGHTCTKAGAARYVERILFGAEQKLRINAKAYLLLAKSRMSF